MYSVLIMNQKTIDSFVQYRPLFFDAINDGVVGICKWNENGTSIDTTIPEIRSLTDDKKEWRAVIVRAYVDDESNNTSDPVNPYDFAVNTEYSEQFEDSNVPLIRLTQMLGGIPPLEVQFKTEIKQEEFKAPKVIYVPIEDPEREAKYNAFASRYKFDGHMPSSIICVTFRIKPEENIVDYAWRDKNKIKESNSSDFWRRNHYPSVCRFLVYDICEEGPIQLEADMYDFWVSVVLIAVNEMDSNVIQAYRLYSVKSDLDLEQMTDYFQNFADRMNYIRHCTLKSLKADQEERLKEDPKLPFYKMKAPVSVSFPKTEDYKVKERHFHLLSTSPLSDMENWEQQKKNAEDKLVKTMKVVERALDQTAVRTRTYKTVDESEVEVLNPYQNEDMNNEVDDLFSQIVFQQSILPDVDIINSKSLQNRAQKVTDYLKGRTMRQPAILVLACVLICLILSIVPGIIDFCTDKTDNLPFGLLSLLIEIGIVLLFALVVILIQRAKLHSLIGNFNDQLSSAFGRLSSCADDYSNYMGNIVSHSRGKSYIEHSDHQIMLTGVKEDSRYKHLKAVELLISKLRSVSKAYGLDIDFDSNTNVRDLLIDYDTEPNSNKLYSFESDNEYSAELNSSGHYLLTPFNFVKGININREELYG